MQRAKDIYSCIKNLHHLTDGQVTVLLVDTDQDINFILFEIVPNDGIYKGAMFHFRVNLDDQYPVSRPTVDCLTPILHPNIDTFINGFEDNVCMTILEEWTPNHSVEDCLQGLMFILHNPNLQDALNPLCDPSLTVDEFKQQVQDSLEGKEVQGIRFPVNSKKLAVKNAPINQLYQER